MDNEALAITARVALRHLNDGTTTDAEKDAILDAASGLLPEPEADAASRVLFHRKQATKHQMVLDGLIAKGGD